MNIMDNFLNTFMREQKRHEQSVKLRLKLIIASLFVLLLLCAAAKADSYVSAGLGIFSSAQNSPSECRFISIGTRSDFGFGLVQQYELGGWNDNAGNGRSGSMYAAYQLGVEVDTRPIVTRATFGPVIISMPDVYLGGAFPQFSTDLYVGNKDSRGNSIGIKYKHISSAGAYQPNVGRDFLNLEVGIPW